MGTSWQVINNFIGSTPTTDGVKGTVPAPIAGSARVNRILKADGTWTANFPGLTPAESTKAVSTWTVRNATAANQWIDVIWVPEFRRFVAIASSGAVRSMYSDDGITWQAGGTLDANLWTSVTYSPELKMLVAVSFDGVNQVATSIDGGVTWVAQTAALAANWYRVVWAPAIGLFVATSLSGAQRVQTSPDGVTWTPQTSPIEQWYSVTWAPELNLLAAVALSGAAMTSPDGVNWTSQTTPGSQSWYDIQWSPHLGLFAAVAISGTRVMTSPDGITWTNRSAPTFLWRRITWAPHLGQFIAVASGGQIMTSTDGLTWTQRTSPQANQWYGVVWSFDLKICVITGITGTNRVLNSTYIGGFLPSGLTGATGATGPTGPTGPAGPASPTGEIPSVSITQLTPQSTSSGTFVDIPGLSTTITTATACKIRANFTGTFYKFAGGGSVEPNIRVVIDAQNGTTNKTTINGTEFKEASGALLSTQLAAGTYTIKVQWFEGTGSGTAGLDVGVLIGLAMQSASPFTLSQAIGYKDDWISPAVTGNLGWTSAVSGTGAANTLVTTNQGANQSGIVQLSTGTTLSGRASLALGASNHFFGGGIAMCEMYVRIPTLSTITDEYGLRLGFGDLVTGADHVDGIYFEYLRATSLNWLLKAANSSVRTTVISSAAVVAGAWIKLGFIVNANGTNVDFYVDGALVGSVTTNIPITVARVSSPTLIITKSVGTLARTLLLDYFVFEQVNTTPR